jgi:two-component system OmpR family response regulator
MKRSDRAVYRRFLPLLMPYRGRLALSLAASATGPLLIAARIWLLKVLIDTVLRGHRPGLLPFVAGGFVAIAIVRGVAITGDDALWMAGSTEYDVIVLDVMLPTIDGFETSRRLRADGIWTPILMLTARDSVDDRIAGLDGGADDYLIKPFSFAELLARIRALSRRGPIEKPTLLTAGDLTLDPASRRVWRDETEIVLSTKEFALLEAFMRRPGDILTRYRLLEQAWDYDYENRSNVIDVYVRYLREKVDRPFEAQAIETIRGTGYRLRADGGRAPAGSVRGTGVR